MEKEQEHGEGQVPARHMSSERRNCPSFRKMFSTKSTDITTEGDVKTEPVSSWIMLVATFLANVLIATADTVFGIFYDHFTEKYDAPRASVGWILSVFAAAGSLSGLVISPFVVMYGCRPVALASLVLLALGTCLSAIAPNLSCLVVFYGVLSGIGWGGIYLVTSTIIQQTFSCHRGLATGIAALGFTTGTILSPILIDFLLSEYNLDGALLILGSIYAQGLVFAMILKTPKRLLKHNKTNTITSKLEGPVNDSGSSELEPPRKDEEPVESPGNDSGFAEFEPSRQDDEPAVNEKSKEVKNNKDEPNATQQSSSKKSIVLLFKSMVDFTVFRKFGFVLAIVYYMFFCMGRYIILSQGVGSALHKDIPSKEAAYLLTIMGVCNLVVRVITTFLLNCSWMNPVIYTCLATFCLAAAGILMSMASTYVVFICGMVCFGVSEGIGVTVMPMVLVHIVGVNRFARAWSILWVGLLPGTMTAGPLSGRLVDVTKSYSPAFILAGVLGAAASVISIVIAILSKMKHKRRKGLKFKGQSEVKSEETVDI